ncbi:MAG: hypothetical protein ACP5MC_01430 [Candidatus Micrarchaeia archaeon]
MPVDVNDILIFKKRGMVQNTAQQPKAQPQAQPQVQEQAKPQTQQARPQFARQTIEKETKQQAKTRAEEEIEKARSIEEEVKKKLEEQELEEETEKLQAMAYEQKQNVEANPTVARTNTFALFAGILLILDASVLGAFSYSQYGLLLGEIEKTGLAFIYSINYPYGVSFLNLLLLFAVAASGLLMLVKSERMYIPASTIAIILLVASAFEYISSNATYLAAVSVLTFLSIGALAYSRMSAIAVEREIEETKEEQEIVWPRIETF